MKYQEYFDPAFVMQPDDSVKVRKLCYSFIALTIYIRSSTNSNLNPLIYAEISIFRNFLWV